MIPVKTKDDRKKPCVQCNSPLTSTFEGRRHTARRALNRRRSKNICFKYRSCISHIRRFFANPELSAMLKIPNLDDKLDTINSPWVRPYPLFI
jgi:hypothetical protein